MREVENFMTAIKEWSTERKKEYLGYALMFLCYILVALFAPQLAEGVYPSDEENTGRILLVKPFDRIYPLSMGADGRLCRRHV